MLGRQDFLDLVAQSPELRAAFDQGVASRREAEIAETKTQPSSVASR
jgi:hypothetical protein